MFATKNDLALGARTKVLKLGDAATADLFTDIARDVDKQPWFLEAHRHAKR